MFALIRQFDFYLLEYAFARWRGAYNWPGSATSPSLVVGSQLECRVSHPAHCTPTGCTSVYTWLQSHPNGHRPTSHPTHPGSLFFVLFSHVILPRLYQRTENSNSPCAAGHRTCERKQSKEEMEREEQTEAGGNNKGQRGLRL